MTYFHTSTWNSKLSLNHILKQKLLCRAYKIIEVKQHHIHSFLLLYFWQTDIDCKYEEETSWVLDTRSVTSLDGRFSYKPNQFLFQCDSQRWNPVRVSTWTSAVCCLYEWPSRCGILSSLFVCARHKDLSCRKRLRTANPALHLLFDDEVLARAPFCLPNDILFFFPVTVDYRDKNSIVHFCLYLQEDTNV